MNKETKEEIKKSLYESKQQSRKLDLLLAETQKQDDRLKKLEDNKSSTNKPKSSKSPKI